MEELSGEQTFLISEIGEGLTRKITKMPPMSCIGKFDGLKRRPNPQFKTAKVKSKIMSIYWHSQRYSDIH